LLPKSTVGGGDLEMGVMCIVECLNYLYAMLPYLKVFIDISVL